MTKNFRLGANIAIFAVLFAILATAIPNPVVNEGTFKHLWVSNLDIFAYLPLDVEDVIMRDHTSNGHDAHVIGNSSYTTNCKFGGCYEFDGDGDYLSDVRLSNSTLFSNSFTATLWVKNMIDLETGAKELMGTESRANLETENGWYVLMNRFEEIEFAISDGISSDFAKSSTDVGVGEWHHVVVVYDKSVPSLRVYVDGVGGIEETDTAPAFGGQVDQDMNIGAVENFDKSWNGSIDDVMFVNEALNESTISDIYNEQYQKYYDKGFRGYPQTNVTALGYTDTVTIQVNQLINYPNINITVRVGNDDGQGGYTFGDEYLVINGEAKDIPITTPDNIKVNVIFNSDPVGFYTPIMIGEMTIKPIIPPYILDPLDQLINGGNLDTLRVLYNGNSRVATSEGFAYDGIEEIAHEADRLSGNGFVVPLEGAGQDILDTLYLFNEGGGMTPVTPDWLAEDENTMLYALTHAGLNLTEGRLLKMADLGSNITLLPKDQEVTLTIQYLKGPNFGEFEVTPVEVENNVTIINSHPSTIIDSDDVTYSVAWQEIVMPVMNDTNLERSFTIEGIEGDSIPLRVNMVRDVPEGISISEMGVGGEGYQLQVDETITLASAWTTYVDAYDPDIILWHFAGNQGLPGVVDATKVLIDRVDSVRENAVHIILIDTPTPSTTTFTIIENSRSWAEDMEGYNGAIVLDPNPFLPEDFVALAGTEELGDYFGNSAHENRLGARIVANAVWDAIDEFVIENS